MRVLIGWGTANVLFGALAGAVAKSERDRQLGLMSAGWGLINAAIGSYGLLQAENQLTTQRARIDLAQAESDQARTQRILLLNAGLDGIYVGSGIYLIERSKRPGSNTMARDLGWGRAIVMQGAALIIFDLVVARYLSVSSLGGRSAQV